MVRHPFLVTFTKDSHSIRIFINNRCNRSNEIIDIRHRLRRQNLHLQPRILWS